MGHNRAFDRPFMVTGGLVKTSGGSNNLVKGQLALVNNRITTPQGVAAVASAAGVAKDDKVFELRLGIADKGVDRTKNNLAQATKVFSLNEVVGLSVSAPKITEQKLDEVILGYDGINPETAFKFKPSDSFFRVTLEIKGGALEYRGGGYPCELVSTNIQVPNCDPFDNCEDCDECEQIDCREIVTEAINVLRRRQLTGGILVEEVVDITPIFSCVEEPETIDYQYFTLSVCDTGTDEALSLVAAQYDAPVIRIDRRGSTSVYQVLVPEGVTPDDYEQTIASLIKGCNDCPPGFDPVVGGYLYAFTIEDDGVDLSAIFEALPGYVADSVVKSGNSAGVGFYTVLVENSLTQAQINTLLNPATAPANAARNTITVSLIGKAADICENDTVEETSWVAGKICGAIEHTYSIILPDNECGEDRLDELNGAYPNLTIEISESAACQTKYVTKVVTNLVCEECDPVFKDFYLSEAPQSFGQEKWVKEEEVVSEPNCLCGIRFKAKPFVLAGEEALRDDIGFVETSSKIRVSADYPTEIREGIGELPTSTAPSRYLSRQQHRTHLAGNLRNLENEGRAYFRDLSYYDSYLSRLLTGTTSHFEDQFKQYVMYTLKVRHNKLSQGFAKEHSEPINYPIFVGVGEHQNVEALLNDIAANAGVSGVQAFPK